MENQKELKGKCTGFLYFPIVMLRTAISRFLNLGASYQLFSGFHYPFFVAALQESHQSSALAANSLPDVILFRLLILVIISTATHCDIVNRGL